VDIRASLDTEARGKTLCLCRGSNVGRPICSQDTILTELHAQATYKKQTHTHSIHICMHARIHTHATAVTRGETATDRVQNVGDATPRHCDPRHDPSYCAAGLHDSQVAVKQEVEREHTAECGRTHLGLCTVPPTPSDCRHCTDAEYHLTKYLITLSTSNLNYIKY
jgi:hypothetical protein